MILRSGHTVDQILLAEGPCLSPQLCKRLEDFGVTPLAARQRVSRAGEPLKRLKELSFPKGARFLYHQSDYNTHRYWDALLKVIDQSSPAYSTAIDALKARGGTVPRSHFGIICGSPVLQKGQIPFEIVLNRLQAVHLIKVEEVEGVGQCIALHAGGFFRLGSNRSLLKGRLLAEKILLLAVKDWTRKLGLVSYDTVALRDEGTDPPKVGTFHWDLTAPSYLSPMTRIRQNKRLVPGFFVCDVVLGEVINEAALEAFVRKCRLSANIKNLAPILAMIVADRFTPEALQLGKSKGLILATPGTLFGTEVAAGLTLLLQTVSKAAAVAVKRPEVIGELFNKLAHIEGAAGNLRGALFELIVGHCVVKVDDGLIDIGKKILDPETGERAEIDVLRIKEHREVWVYECKGHQPSQIIDGPTIEKWLTNRVSLIHRILSREPRFQRCEFHYEYWTCGTFSAEAIQRLTDASSRTKRYSIGWKDGGEVRAYAGNIHPPALAETLDQHFFQHPIARFDNRNDAVATFEELIQRDANSNLFEDGA